VARMGRQPGWFDVDACLRELSAKGDDLERRAGLVDFEVFRSDLERAGPRSAGSQGGRPPFDHVLMFKVLRLQAMPTLSDERCEYPRPAFLHARPGAWPIRGRMPPRAGGCARR
jgi:transposase, IS5 family